MIVDNNIYYSDMCFVHLKSVQKILNKKIACFFILQQLLFVKFKSLQTFVSFKHRIKSDDLVHYYGQREDLPKA